MPISTPVDLVINTVDKKETFTQMETQGLVNDNELYLIEGDESYGVINVEADTSLAIINIGISDSNDICWHKFIAPKEMTFAEWIDSPLYDSTGWTYEVGVGLRFSCDRYTNVPFGFGVDEIIAEDRDEVTLR